jgi:hypothetical protein
MHATHAIRSSYVFIRSIVILAAICALGTLGGCNSAGIAKGVPESARDFTPHLQQVLDNLAHFSKDPGAWPAHVLVYKGTWESKDDWSIALGFPLNLSNERYAMTRWELANLDDPYDIRRVRLLYQWQTGYISFDQLEQQWNEIRDRAILDGAGKVVLGSDGRPTFLPLPLPVTRETKRNWTTTELFDGLGGLAGHSGAPGVPGTVTLWVTDSEAATQFSLAILSAMANTRVKARWGDAVMMTP